jgi:hypothetical protein
MRLTIAFSSPVKSENKIHFALELVPYDNVTDLSSKWRSASGLEKTLNFSRAVDPIMDYSVSHIHS